MKLLSKSLNLTLACLPLLVGNALGQIYSTTGSGTGLARISSTTGSGSFVGSSGFSDCFAAAFDTNGALYTTITGFGSAQLAIFNTNNGLAAAVGAPMGIQAICLELDAKGRMYTIGYANGALYQVNKTTGALTFIGNTGILNMMDLAFDSTGTLWATVGNNLWTINVLNGAPTFKVSMIGVQDIMGIMFGSNDTLYATDYRPNGNLYTINKATGVATLVGATSLNSPHGGDIYLPPPSISTQPQSLIVTQGYSATFNVAATGASPLSYQWRKNGTDVSGATASIYSIAVAQLSNAADYSVVVTNVYGAVTSSVATLTVRTYLADGSLFPASSGQDGDYLPTSSTSLAGGTYYFRDFIIPSGLTINVTGNNPLRVYVQRNASISGILSANGGIGGNGTAGDTPGGAGGTAGAGGSAGGSGGGRVGGVISTSNNGYGPGGGIGASSAGVSIPGGAGGAGFSANGTTGANGTCCVPRCDTVQNNPGWPGGSAYSSNNFAVQFGGSGGGGGAASGADNGSGGGGGGGGGAILIESPTLVLAGTGRIECKGGAGGSVIDGSDGSAGGGGSGGSIWLRAMNFTNSASLLTSGGAGGTTVVGSTCGLPGAGGGGANGRIRIDYVNANWSFSYSGSLFFDNLTLYSLPIIATQPAHRTNQVATTATFSTTLTTPTPATYQWYKLTTPLANGGNVSGADTATLSLSSVALGDAGDYSVVITNVAGAVTSSVATLTVVTKPSIDTPPAGAAIDCSASHLMTVTASGTGPLSYQWRLGGAPISGATTTSYNATGTPTPVGNYTVVVTNLYGAVTSSVAALSLTTPLGAQPDAMQTVTNTPLTFSPSALLVNDAVVGNTPPAPGSSLASIAAVSFNGGTIGPAVTGAVLWTNRFNSLGSDAAPGVAADGSGNIYVTGSSDSDATTMAYDPSGTPLWTNRFYGSPIAIAVGGGHVYVAARSSFWSGWQFKTVAYTLAGTPLWTNTYGSPVIGGDSFARGLAVDTNTDVYVTGQSPLISGNDDYVTIKYSSLGVPLWTNRFDGGPGSADIPRAITADTNGLVYVTGTSGGGNVDIVTVAYTATGVPNWTNRYDANAYDAGYAIAAGPGGRVFVTGYGGVNGDFLTLAYSSAGTPLWTNLYNGPANGQDLGRAVVVDSSGNVVVTGDSASATYMDYTTIAYSPSGTPLWTNRYDGTGSGYDTPLSIAADTAGHVFVTGYSWNGANNDWVTIAYSSAGAQIWSSRYEGEGYDDFPGFVAVDSSGNVLVTGRSSNGSNDDFATIKYAALSGPVQYAYTPPPAFTGTDTFTYIITNACGQSFTGTVSVLVGYPPIIAMQPAGQTKQPGMAASFSVTGSGSPTPIYQWRKGGTDILGATAATYLIPSCVLGDAGGYSVVLSNSFGSVTSSIATLSVVTDGEIIYAWTNFVGYPALSGTADGTGYGARFNYPVGVAVDSAGNVYVADSVNHTIRKATPAGVVTTLAGSAGFFGTADGTGSAARFNNPQGVAVDSAGNVYVADWQNHTIRKITPGGTVTTLAGSPGVSGSADGTGSGARFAFPYGVAVDIAGNVYVADQGNHTIRKVTSGGVVTTLAGNPGVIGSADGTGSAARFKSPKHVAVDSAGDVYVADTYNHTVRKVTTAGVVTTLAGSAGVIGDADGIGSAARFNFPYGVAVDGVGNVFVADNANGTVRKISGAGVVTTIGSVAGAFGTVDGIGSDARFDSPIGIAVDAIGDLFLSDYLNHRISKATPLVNRSPVAVTDTFTRPPNTAINLTPADLLGNDTDADLDALTLTGVTLTTTNGVTLFTNSSGIYYENANNVSDRFDYTISDGRGGVATGTVLISVESSAGQSANLVSYSLNGLGEPQMQFAGIPGQAYAIQRAAPTLSDPWVTVRTTNAPPLGIFQFTDASAPPGDKYYRTLAQ